MAGKDTCRLCSDFKNWSRNQQQRSVDISKRKDCPVDGMELGRATWTFLHTVAAYYPTSPSSLQQKDMKEFVRLVSKVYPCEECAHHMQERLKQDPPATASQKEFSQWMCRLHNEVNERLDKPQFDCSKVDERWLGGWNDGSCD